MSEPLQASHGPHRLFTRAAFRNFGFSSHSSTPQMCKGHWDPTGDTQDSVLLFTSSSQVLVGTATTQSEQGRASFREVTDGKESR